MRFVEIALIVDRTTALQAFSERSRAPSTQSHVDAAELVERSGSLDAVADMYDAFSAMLEQRPNARRVDVEIGDVDGTLGRLERAIETGLTATTSVSSECDVRHNWEGLMWGQPCDTPSSGLGV